MRLKTETCAFVTQPVRYHRPVCKYSLLFALLQCRYYHRTIKEDTVRKCLACWSVWVKPPCSFQCRFLVRERERERQRDRQTDRKEKYILYIIYSSLLSVIYYNHYPRDALMLVGILPQRVAKYQPVCNGDGKGVAYNIE